MSKSPMVKSDRVLWDGGQPHLQNSGLQSWGVGAVSNLGAFVAPCRMKLVGILMHSPVAATSAAAKVDIGKQGAGTYFVNGYLVQNLTGYNEIPLTDASVAQTILDKGEMATIGLEAATAVGNIAVTAIWVPAPGAGA